MTDETRVMPAPEPRSTRKRRMSRGQRWFIRLLIALVLLAALAVGAVYVSSVRMGNVGELASLGSSGNVYLIAGTDSRENLPDDLEGSFGDFGGERADVIMLLQVEDGNRQLLSLPRDLKVDVAGHGTNKINAAYAFGGPDLLVDTVSRETGITVTHYMEVDFGGFAGIVDSLGGIELDFEYPSRDLKSGLEVDAGTQTVDGSTALAYARSRSLEEFRDGEWRSGSGGDIARTGRQREVLLKIITKVSSPSGVVRSPLVLTEVTGALSVDESVNPLALARLGWAFRSASSTQAISLPVVNSNEGGVSYVVRAEPAATEVLDAFRAGVALPEG